MQKYKNCKFYWKVVNSVIKYLVANHPWWSCISVTVTSSSREPAHTKSTHNLLSSQVETAAHVKITSLKSAF